MIGAAIVFALIPTIGLPLFYALPLIGLALAAGSPPDYVADAKPVARRTRRLVMIYRPAVNPVPIASPLAEEWLVGQGGHAELVNYHHVTSTQRDAHDILQVRDGRTHQPRSTELTSYYIYEKPVLAPTAGTVTFVLDGRPDVRVHRCGAHAARYRIPTGWRRILAEATCSGPANSCAAPPVVRAPSSARPQRAPSSDWLHDIVGTCLGT